MTEKDKRILDALTHLAANKDIDKAIFLITSIIEGKTDEEITEDVNAEQRLRNIPRQ